MIKHSTTVDAEDENGNQPLHLASTRGHIETGSLLMSDGADANALKKHGQTPLHVAAGGEKDKYKYWESVVVTWN